ncbi:MAG: SdiA-regulated domain-containing protein [Calditrichaeota bacterium]|nr:SdiA-regulated domain-containing protein [Calditrichota bacterium]
MNRTRSASIALLLPVLLGMGGCYDDPSSFEEGSWTLVATFPLSVTEPSGLCLDQDGRTFWTVSDETAMVYRLDREGRVLQTLSYVGEDLEGICLDPLDGSLWVAEERRRQAVHLSRTGTVLDRLDVEQHGAANSGLEGICFDGDGQLLLLNEKDPGRLLCVPRTGGASTGRDLDFARDYSGLCWDEPRQSLWVLSDESRALFRLREDQSPVRYSLDLPRIEGIAVEADTAWVVSDSYSKLFRIQFD